MSNDIYLIGEVGYDITLKNVIELVDTTNKKKPLNVHIHSEGGYVYEGRAIYNYLKSLDQEVNTYAVGLVASIATIIMLAGKNKNAYSQNNVLIHLPSNIGVGNAKDLEASAKDLREEEEKLAEVYESETDFTKEEALALMQEDRMMTNEEIKKFGLTIKPYKAVAKYNNNNNNKMTELTEENKSWFAEQFAKLKNSISPNIQNKILQDAQGGDVDFYELESEDNVKIGDKARIDGKDADGEVLMGSEKTFVFEGGELKEIKEKEAAPDEKDTEIENLKNEIETLKGSKETELNELRNSKETELNELKASFDTQIKEFKAEVKSKFNLDTIVEDKNKKTINIFK